MTDDKNNGLLNSHDHYLWTCPGCNVTYINSDYCYRCDIQGQESDSEK